jgi:hypothetical protein
MPTFHVTGPDGHTYEINASEGATEQDAIAYAQSNLGNPQGQSASPAVGASQAPQSAPAEQSLMGKVGD